MTGGRLVFEDAALRLAIRLATALGFRAAIRHAYCGGNMTEVLELAYLRPERKCLPGRPQPAWLWRPDWQITPLESGEIALDHPEGNYPRQLFGSPSAAVAAALRSLEPDNLAG